MGEISEMMMDGTLCCSCGAHVGSYIYMPTECRSCASVSREQNKVKQKEKNIEKNSRQEKTKCPKCGKKVKIVGLNSHINDVHKTTMVDLWIE